MEVPIYSIIAELRPVNFSAVVEVFGRPLGHLPFDLPQAKCDASRSFPHRRGRDCSHSLPVLRQMKSRFHVNQIAQPTIATQCMCMRWQCRAITPGHPFRGYNGAHSRWLRGGTFSSAWRQLSDSQFAFQARITDYSDADLGIVEV